MTKMTKTPILPPNFDPSTKKGQKQILFIEAALAQSKNYYHLRSGMFEMIFSSRCFLQKTKERILLYYYETSSWLVSVRFLEEIEDTKKTFRN